MRSTLFKSVLIKSGLVASVLMLASGAAFAQQTVNLTAAPTTTTLPDGTVVPMWGYTCGTAATSTIAAVAIKAGGSGYAVNDTLVFTNGGGSGAAATVSSVGTAGAITGITVSNSGTGYTSAPAITVTSTSGTGALLTAAVTGNCAALNKNALTGWSPVVITVPTGQTLQINLTNNLTFTAGTTSNTVPTSLAIVGQLGAGLGTTATSTPSPTHAPQGVTWSTVNPAVTNQGPPQGPRVQSFSTEVASGATTALTWTNLRPGTYLIESGTHPSIQGPMGLYGILVVTTAPNGTTAGNAYGTVGSASAVAYNAEVSLLLSEIDPVQNIAVDTAVRTAGFSETKVWSGQPGGCGNPSSGVGTVNTCYPPVVNYTPLYYLFNGVAFDKTHASASLFPAVPAGTTAAPVTGNVLVRLVNAGVHMHVPSIVGSQTTPLTVPKGATAAVVPGFSLIAEDGNPLPGITRVQSEVFMAAGKTYDVMVTAPAAGGTALPVFDRELSLSGNATTRDAGMLAYVSVNGAGLPAAAVAASAAGAVARTDTYNSVISGRTLTVSDPAKGLIANDTNVYGVQLVGTVAGLTLNSNGTFTYTGAPTTFTYCANGTVTAGVCSSGITATVNLNAATIEAGGGISCTAPSFTSNTAGYLEVKPPGLLAGCTDAAGYPLHVVTTGAPAGVVLDAGGGFTVTGGVASFNFTVQNSQLTTSSSYKATLTYPIASNLAVTVLDGNSKDVTNPITDYRWIIEEDRTFFVDPKCTTNPLPAGCPTVTATGTPAVFGTNFHSSHMPVVATGCTGTLSCENGETVLGVAAACDVGNGVCETTNAQKTAVLPSQVHLDPTKRYYISVLPGDAAQPFIAGYGGAPDCSTTGVAAGHCGHGMGGAPIAAPCPHGTTACTATTFAPITVLSQPSPYPPAKLAVFVFEDDFPLNGEHNAGGGIDILSPQEPGLGGFQITLFDDAGATGDATGTPTYDMFNQPLSNSLAGTIDPVTGKDACPIGNSRASTTDPTQTGITGMIITCPKYESDGITLSPMAGQAVVANLYPGRYGVAATPGADRIARGEEWLQTNTLDGQKAHDSFMRIGEPGYFQEFGPGGYHVTIGFANPQIINDRKPGLCTAATPCNNEVKGHVTTARMSRTPDQRLYGSGDRESFAFTQCYASLGDPDGAEFAFVKCDASGNFDFTGIPAGNWKLTLFDQWNDQIVDGISTAVGLACKLVPPATTCPGKTLDMGEVAAHQWQANFFTRTFLDLNGDGVSQGLAEPGLALVKTNVRYRDGSFSNRNNTDLNGYAAFNEEFPLFNWYVIETDVTRYKNTGTHVVYDAGGPTDTTCTSGTAPCGSSSIAAHFANTYEAFPLPGNLSVPGAVYCATADCNGSGETIANGPKPSSTTNHSTGRIDPPWVLTEGWQGFSGQNNFLEFGKKPYAVGENGGIRGHVVYSSTRPFDDPQFNTQNVWEPLVPNVTINLYQEGTAPDGTPSLTLVDTTQTSSFDAWAQGFRSDNVPNMNCPGQSNTDPFYLGGLINQPSYLDWYNSQHGGPAVTPLPYTSQYKCYDGMHNWNQLQPAPYDGMYQFPSVTGMNPTTGKPTGTNCKVCVANPDATDPYRARLPMLPKGKYVVEVVLPSGFSLVKEEDKNILIGDNFIAPVTQQFGGLGNVFILPDQASIASSYNSNSANNPTNSFGRVQTLTSHEGDTPTVDTFWPCVGATRTVPDYISLFPGSKQVAPFAGATRNLCDRKEVTLDDQTSSQAEFFVWTPTHIASHFTGVITDDFSAEFDPYSPQFGEKFAPAYLPVSVKDWAGNEISRIYSDQWGAYNGLGYSTWEVNPPNPTGYAPTMMVTCMNDRGSFPDPVHPGQTVPDPLFQPGYSQFCYELAFMPGETGYFDTPVVPTSAFSEGYNHPDCNYPDATPAIASVTGDVAGPWVALPGSTLTITSLGDQLVDSYGYSGPSVTTAPFNQQKVTRHYGFGSCTLTNGACTNGASVTIGGVSAPVTGWSDTSITVTAPATVPACAIQQQTQYGGPPVGSPALCGQLVITAGNGKQSIDAVTVTVGGKKPTVLTAGQTIQSAIDAAKPGDMVIVPPGTYNEMLLMWKPVRLQGIGAASTVINANAHPAGRLDPWRRQVVCLFGLALNGTPISAGNPYDQSGTYKCDPAMQFSVDRLPLEATVGWTALLNGNLAEQLSEPSLMGAYEGAGITVLGKGVKFTTTDPAVIWASDVFPAGTLLLKAADCTAGANSANPYPSNFLCNPSSIDGLSVANSSQGGGGIQVHGWGHNLQIANNRVHNNQGTLSGGITIGQGEHPDVFLAGSAPTTIPGSCESDPLGTLQPGQVPNQALPFCFDLNVNVHNNAVTTNSSLGDELFSSTPAGAGGVTMCNGSDYYKFNNNWVCGNMSTGDGAGVVHLGFSKNGDVEHNSILFNQSINPTITTNGGGLLVMGAPDQDPPCGITTDKDCLSAPNTISPSDGTGPGLVINANLIMGNSADAGSGGGLRLQHVNGTDLINFPNGAPCEVLKTHECHWNTVSVTNNIIANNVAGWDGGGLSLQDALAVDIVNNTIISNDSTASAGPLFGSLFAPLASTPGVNCNTAAGDQSCPQVAGLVSVTNSPVLVANLPAGFSCPPKRGGGPGNGNVCKTYSDPFLTNNVIWQNRSFVIGVGNFGAGTLNQQKLVTLYNAAFYSTPATVPAPSQTATGGCTAASYWDIGVRGDLGPANHAGGLLAPRSSILTDAADYPLAHNLGSNPAVVSQYCNGSRVPPELGSMGYTVNPGTNETNGLPTPVFSLTPSATVDEGNNWINLRWGPLALTSPSTGKTLGNYVPTANSPTIDQITTTTDIAAYNAAPKTDFFGNPRPDTGSAIDIGAVEFQSQPATAMAQLIPNPLAFGNHLIGTSTTQTVTLTNIGGGTLTLIGFTISGQYNLSPATTCAANMALAAGGGNCTFSVRFAPTSAGAQAGTLSVTTTDPVNPTVIVALTGTGTGLASIAPNNGVRGTAVPVSLAGFALTGATAVNTDSPNITVSNFVAANDTTVTATLHMTPATALGPHNITVTTPGGTTNAVIFTVTGATVNFAVPTMTTTPADTKTKNGTVTVSNDPLATGPYTFTAAPTIVKANGPGVFSIQTGGTCVSGAVVNPGASCTINVRYVPGTSTGMATANVTITGTGTVTATRTSGNITAN